MRRINRRKNNFKKSLLIYTGVLGVLAIVFLIYIFVTLVSYEDHQMNNFLKNTIHDLSDEELISYLEDNDLSSDLLDTYKKITKSDDFVYEKVDDDTYDIYLNDRLIFTISSKVVDTKTKLGLFSYQIREVENIIPNLARGLFYYDVIIPSNYQVLVDGKVMDNSSSEENFADLDFMYYNDSMPKLSTYEINDLNSEKEITFKDFLGNDVNVDENNFVYQNDDYFIHVETLEEAKEYIDINFDIIKLAHNWHLFLTRDLTGPWYGLGTVTEAMIEGTSVYDLAYNWAHGVDITFTSKHTLGNPIWPVERLENFVIYGLDAFSCEVYLEKDMIVAGKHQSDIMHDTLYFIKDNEGNWKLINIKAVEDDSNE